MTAPAVTSILDLMAARLVLITTTNEYNYTILSTSIKRAKLTSWKSEDLPAINYWSTGLESIRNNYEDDERSIPLYIEAHTKTHDENFLDVASKLAADIVTAINRKSTAPKVSDAINTDLDGKVSDIIFNGYDHEIGSGQKPWCGVLVNFTIKYNTTIFNMTSYNV